MTPHDLTDPANKELRRALEDAVYDSLNRGDAVEEQEEEAAGDGDSDAGSASDEEEAAEYQRMKQAKKAAES